MSIVALFASCYRPASLDGACAIACDQTRACPSDRSCVAGFCVRAGEACGDPAPVDGAALPDGLADDAPPRPPPVSCIYATYTTSSLIGGVQTAYTEQGAVHAFVDPTGNIVVGGATAYPATKNLTEPRLASGGTELFMLETGGALVHGTFAGTWSLTSQVETHGMTGFAPGTVSSTTPRHMVVSVGGALYEGVEGVARDWTFVALPTIANFTSITDPSLSEDGNRIVFVGQDTFHSHPLIYFARRGDVASAFVSTVPIFDPVTPHDPFLPSDNCTYLYLSNGTAESAIGP